MDKVTSIDTGGAGNCGYTCLAAALAIDKGETFDQVKGDLQARARTIRNDIYKHLDKYSSEYKEYFAPAEANESIDAGPSPTTWGEYLECTLREGRWIDGLSLRAASKRYGVHIVVIPLEGEEKDKPMAFGTPRSGREPIVLLLNDRQGHYTLLQLKTGRQWPKEWTQADQAPVDSVALRGGGKAPAPARSCASSSHSWRPAHTPESKPRTIKSAGSIKSHTGSWRPACTPASSRKLQTSSANGPKSTSSRTKPHSVSAKEPSRHSWRCDATPKTFTAKRSRQCQPASSKQASVFGVAAKKQEWNPCISEQFVWTCNLCQQVFRYNNKKSLSCARRRHIAKAHRTKRKAVHTCFLPKNKSLDPIAEASDQIPTDQRAWTCKNAARAWLSWRNSS